MTYDSSRQADARIPVTVVELYLDTCSNTFGSAPCTASGAAGTECYNTYLTCQDTANFTTASKTYRFYQGVKNWPIGITGYPCVKNQPKFTPCQIDPKGTLGKRGVVSIKLDDFTDDDLYTDDYVSTRAYNPELQGTFFGKLKARTPYYKGRLMKVRQGYINNPFSWTDFDDRLFVIDSLDLDQDGKVTVTGKDILKLADDKKSVAPAANTGTLSVALTTGATSIVLQTGEGVDYDSAGFVRIGDEVMQYTAVSTDTLTGVTRASNGTTAEEHDIDDLVQQCLSYSNDNVVDIIHGLLNTYAGIAENYLPYYGIDKVQDGGFTLGVSEWSDISTGTGAVSAGNPEKMDLLSNSGSDEGIAEKQIITAIGIEYTVSIDVESLAGTNYFKIGAGTASGLSDVGLSPNLSANGSYDFTFTATSELTYVNINHKFSNTADTAQVDNVSIVGSGGEWDLEKIDWLGSNNLTHLITKPTGINKLISNICKQNLIYMWFDERDQEVKLRAIAPQAKNETPPTLSDSGQIIRDSIKVKDNPKDRISQIWVYYDILDISGDLDKAENYKKLYVQVDTESENTNAYSEKAIKIIYADWLSNANAGLITTLAGRLLSRYAGTPQRVTFKIDHKDADIWTGNIALLDSWAFQDETGANSLQKTQVLKVTDDHDKQQLTIEAESWEYAVVLYGFVTPNTMLDYLSESDANKAAYGFICDNTGKMSNSDNGYLIA